ncbi:MAG: chorismate synthase [Candidatus Cloacimonadales bacterium]
MNSFGRLLRVEIFGESHGSCVGVLLDGVPSGIELGYAEITLLLDRRRAGKLGTTARQEADIPEFKSGVYQNKTTGAPILITFLNNNISPSDYELVKDIPRPNHADFTASCKYHKHNDTRGGGHFSGRLTAGLVVAGYLAKKVIPDIAISAKILSVGGEEEYHALLKKAVEEKDSLGAEIGCVVENIPVGLGEPFFDSVESLLAHAIFSIPGVKGIQFGLEKDPITTPGSEFNDLIVDEIGTTQTNNSGGIVGGITNGNRIEFKVAIKPTASIGKAQKSFSYSRNKMVEFAISGRHDVCFGLRVPVVIEAVTALVLADLSLLANAYREISD